jgi:hypothetical protein
MKLEDFKGCIRPLLVLIVLPPLVASVFLYHARIFLFLYNYTPFNGTSALHQLSDCHSLASRQRYASVAQVPHHPHHEPVSSIDSRNSFSPAVST